MDLLFLISWANSVFLSKNSIVERESLRFFERYTPLKMYATKGGINMDKIPVILAHMAKSKVIGRELGTTTSLLHPWVAFLDF